MHGMSLASVGSLTTVLTTSSQHCHSIYIIFSKNHFYIQSQESKFSKFFWRKSMLLHTKQARPTICQTLHFTSLNFTAMVMLMIYERSSLKPNI